MRRPRSLRAAALALGLAAVLPACAEARAGEVVPVTGAPRAEPSPANIPEMLARDEQNRFSTLLDCVQLAGLAEPLSGPGPLTVFAPTNTAFAQAGVSCPENAQLTDEQRQTLVRTLQMHAAPVDVTFEVPEDVDAADPPRGMVIVQASPRTVDALLRDSIYARLQLNPGPPRTVTRIGPEGNTVTITDSFEAPTGYVHVINGVISPPGLDTPAPEVEPPDPFG